MWVLLVDRKYHVVTLRACFSGLSTWSSCRVGAKSQFHLPWLIVEDGAMADGHAGRIKGNRTFVLKRCFIIPVLSARFAGI